MDHIGKTAREQSARFILHLIDSMCLAKSKVVLTGDMNAEPDEAPLQVFKTRFDDLYQTPSIQHYGPPGTFNNFKTDQPVTKRIDYIFVKNGVNVLTSKIIGQEPPYGTDHAGVVTSLVTTAQGSTVSKALDSHARFPITFWQGVGVLLLALIAWRIVRRIRKRRT